MPPQTLPKHTELTYFPAGATIFDEGAPGNCLFLVVAGVVSIVKRLGGSERELNVLEAGDFFGEMSLLQGARRSATARAATEIKLLRIDQGDFQKLLELDVEVPIRIMRRLARSLERSERRVETLLQRLPESQRGELFREPAPSPASGAAVAELRLEDRAESFAIRSDAALIGRADRVTGIVPDVDLSGVDPHHSVSRYHARLLRAGEGFQLVEEVAVKNGTRVNDQRLRAGVPVPVEAGDRVIIGFVALRFCPAAGR